MLLSKSNTNKKEITKPLILTRSAMLVTSWLAGLGGTLIYLIALPVLWRLSWPYGMVFTVVGVLQLGAFGAALARPERGRVLLAAGTALVAAALWVLQQSSGILPPPDPWAPVNSLIGFAGAICAGLQMIAFLGMSACVPLAEHQRRSPARRVITTAALIPVVALVLIGTGLGAYSSIGGLSGAVFPVDAAAPKNLPPGQMRTLEYCRPDGIPLAMDLYTPSASPAASPPAPVILYVHGGGFLGTRKTSGTGALLANHDGALFTALQQGLNARGFAVAAIDHRLPPGTPWPAQIEDAKCAVRFLRAHAEDLRIDPNRIGVWGSSGGGHLASMLGLAGPEAGYDRGQYLDQSGEVQAVVDMFGGTDLNDMDDASPFLQILTRMVFGGSPETRRSASPINYVDPGDPPFLILQGAEDEDVLPRQSIRLVEKLRAAGVPAAYVEVKGAGHGLNNPDQQPSPEALTAQVIDFFVAVLQ